MTHHAPRPASTPWTNLLRDVVDKNHRTANAQKLIVTTTGCVIVLLAAAALALGLAGGWQHQAAYGLGAVLSAGSAGWYAYRRCTRRRRTPSQG